MPVGWQCDVSAYTPFAHQLQCPVLIAAGLFLVQVAMLTWAYFAALATDPGEVPVGWHPFPDDAVSRAPQQGHRRMQTGL